MERLSDVEKDIIRLRAAEQRVEVLRQQIERLKANGRPTEVHQQLLRTLQSSLQLMQAHVRRSTGSGDVMMPWEWRKAN